MHKTNPTTNINASPRSKTRSETRSDKKSEKNCLVCRQQIIWHRWLDRDWEKVIYCGPVCRRAAVAQARDKAA